MNYQKDWKSFHKAIIRAKADFHRFTDVNTGKTMVLLDKHVETKEIKSSTMPLGMSEYDGLLDKFIAKPNRKLEGNEMHDSSRKFKGKVVEEDREKARVYMIPCKDKNAVAKRLERKFGAKVSGYGRKGDIFFKPTQKSEDFLDSISGDTNRISPRFKFYRDMDDAFDNIVELTGKSKRNLHIDNGFDEDTQGFPS
jgi:hypothetical protein